MIERISIENFRCFKKIDIQNFKQINLLGGKNNSGKTNLLEAIYFTVNPLWHDHIMRYRHTYLNEEERLNALFFNYEVEKSIKITPTYDKKKEYESFIFEQNKLIKYEEKEPEKKTNPNISIIFSKNDQFPIRINITEVFDKLDREGEADIIKEAIRVIDSNIDDIKTYSSKPNLLYLRQKGQKKYIPLSDYGDALQKIVRYIVTIADFDKSSEFKYLLIDEVENGLHFETHYKFWLMLFKLAKEYNIQIFATSHSLEMIRAFNEVAMQEGFAGDAMYFEMSRHFKTQNIIANPMDMDMLHYELVTQNPFRGE